MCKPDKSTYYNDCASRSFMARQPSAVLSLSLSQESWRDAVRSFVAAEKRDVFQVEVSVDGPGSRIIALDSWMSGARSPRSMAEGIVDWIELRREIAGARDLEATISIWPKPYDTAERADDEENHSYDAVPAAERQSGSDFEGAYHTRERRSLFSVWRLSNHYVNTLAVRFRG
jgi:hypothetical protein